MTIKYILFLRVARYLNVTKLGKSSSYGKLGFYSWNGPFCFLVLKTMVSMTKKVVLSSQPLSIFFLYDSYNDFPLQSTLQHSFEVCKIL